jgi:hypothetical protein
MLVLLSNRGDAGFDSRTLVNVGFKPGQLLVELSGNAADRNVNPDRGGGTDIPPVLRVFEEGGVSKANVRFQRPGTMGPSGQFVFHGRGLLVYGLPTPQSDAGLEITNEASVMKGQLNPANDRENGLRRQASISVIRNDAFEVRLRTRPVRLLGSDDLRDVAADGDNALLRVDAGRDVNGNGVVDFTAPATTEYGFERFVTKRSPLVGPGGVNGSRGDGEFRQAIDATRLEEGMHFLTARAYRHRTDGGPAVFSDFRRVIYVDRRPPVSAIDSVRRTNADEVEVIVRSQDGTAESVHVLPNLAAGVDDAGVLALVQQGQGRADRLDRALFRVRLRQLAAGSATLTVVAFEPSGTRSVQRINVTVP